MNLYKTLLGLCIALMPLQDALACDICGCGAGSSYLGILPDFNTRIAGLRFRANEVKTHLAPDGSASYLTTREHYYTTEAWLGWTIAGKFRLMATVPFSYNTKSSIENKASKSGMGDASLQGYYRLLSRRKTVGRRLWVQDLWLGGGIKLPTGKYTPADREASGQSANLFQLGTGSTDFLLSLMYDLRLQDAGLNVSAGYKINTTNKYDYYYGNKFNGNLQLYYKFKIMDKVTVAPNLGASLEQSLHDLNGGYSVYTSGGYALYATTGAECTAGQFAFGGNFQPVLKQGLAGGVVSAGSRMMLHFSILF